MIPFRGRSVKRGEGAPGQALTYDIHKGPGRETARAGAPRWLPCSRRIVRRGGKAAGALGHGEMTHPCPAGQDMLPVRGFDAVCPWGAKALQSWRAGFWVVAGESRKSRRFARQERLAGAPGDGERGAAFYNFTHPQKPTFRPFRTPCFACHPAGGTAGSARTRSRDSSLENPFLGNRPVPLQSPAPKTPQAAGLCSRACRRLLPPPPQPERNAASPPHS